jgi:hypothetical protein
VSKRAAFPPPYPIQSAHHPQQAVARNSKADPYHGQEYLAKIAARFITHLFACPDYPPSSTHAHAKLPYIIAYALHRTKLHQSVMFAALVPIFLLVSTIRLLELMLMQNYPISSLMPFIEPNYIDYLYQLS